MRRPRDGARPRGEGAGSQPVGVPPSDLGNREDQVKIIRKGHEDECLAMQKDGGALRLIFAAWMGYRGERARYERAVGLAREVLINEARRLDSGAPAPDNSLGLLQDTGTTVDLQAVAFHAAYQHLRVLMHHFGIYLESAMWPNEVDEIEDQVGKDDCDCDEPLLEPGKTGRVQCEKCGGAREVK